jgi:regulatory protein
VGRPQAAPHELEPPADRAGGQSGLAQHASGQPAQHPLDRALTCAYRHLGRCEHSVAELRSRLERARTDPEIVEEALAILAEQGYLDDARYTRMLVEDRRSIDGWGEQRIRARLARAGIERDTVEQALGDGGHAGELAAATSQLEHRWRQPPADDRERQRAFGQLIRMGYEPEVAYDAIRAHARSARDSAGSGGAH